MSVKQAFRPRPGPELTNAERAEAMLGDVAEALHCICAGLEAIDPQLVLVEIQNIQFIRALLRGEV
jgi:hypothetical protein